MAKPISFQGVYPILATPFRDDESLDLDPIELIEAARPRLRSRALGRLEREREAEDTRRSRRTGRPAGDARARRASADDEWQLVEPAPAERLDDGRPRGIELRRGRR
jgi:hypothetical protein